MRTDIRMDFCLLLVILKQSFFKYKYEGPNLKIYNQKLNIDIISCIGAHFGKNGFLVCYAAEAAPGMKYQEWRNV